MPEERTENQNRENLDRTPRDAQDRAHDERYPDTWVPPSTLPTPEPKDGYGFRWIRISFTKAGGTDGSNVSRKFREGWRPVSISEYPQYEYDRDDMGGTKWADNIVIGGLLLCKCPQELIDQRNQYYQDKADRQIQSARREFFNSKNRDPNVKQYDESTSRVTYGKPR